MTQTVEERLLILMRNKKMSKTELAKEIGVSRQAVYSWFLDSDNKREVSNKAIHKIASLFGVSDHYLKYGVSDVGQVCSLSNVSDCVSCHGILKFVNEVKDEILVTLKKKFGCDINTLRYVHLYDEAMYPTFQDGDKFLIDTVKNQSVTKDGYYLIVTDDKVSIRHIAKDSFTLNYYLTCGNASYEDQKLSENQFKDTVKEVYRIFLVQREL